MKRSAPITAALTLLLAACATTGPADDRPITEAELREHIAVLASDRFEGRKPGTLSAALTTDYIVGEWTRAGLRPAGTAGWLQPVPLANRAPGRTALTLRGARSLALAPEAVIGIGGEERVDFSNVELVEVDLAAPFQPEQVRGKVAVVRANSARAGGSRGSGEALAAARPAAILILSPSEGWAATRDGLARPTTRVSRRGEPLQLFMDAGRFDAIKRDVGTGPLRLSGTVEMNVRAYTSPNVIGRIPGTGNTGEAIAIIGHWDHVGICRPEGAPDRICNGAVDNASGIAVMIEVAERLARGPRPVRDILFIATTAEESGLLGARHYVANPTVPLPKLVGVLNIDTIAIGPRGLPVSAVNRGNTSIDPLIDAAARIQGRALDQDLDANAFINRQDGAPFTEAGVPAVMAGGSFADMPMLQRFLGSTYHGPEDELTDALPLGGAAEDGDLHVILARMLADPKRYPTPKRP